jgi:DNA-binding transcriptional LysR family regulator
MAAEELHLSQSAVSIQISTLETAAGAPLVNRTGRGVRLTEAGELLLNYADRLLALWTETSDELSSFLGAFSGTLRIGAITSSEFWLPRFLVAFVKQNPKVKIKLHVANRDDIVGSLTREEVDIAVMGRPPHELAVASFVVGSNPMAFLAAPHDPLSRGGIVTLADIAAARLLVRERGSGTRRTLERVFKDAGLHMRIGSELSSNEAIKHMCAAGFGPAYLSLMACILELEAGLLKILPMVDNPTEREWNVVHVAARQPPQVALAFEQFMRQEGQAQAMRSMWQHLVPKARRARRAGVGASRPVQPSARR